MPKMHFTFRLAVLSGIAVLPGCAGLEVLNAFSDEGFADMLLEAGDTDKNGKINFTEYQRVFVDDEDEPSECKIVAEHDKKVQEEREESLRDGSLRERFDKIDGNKDGSLTREEIITSQQNIEYEDSSEIDDDQSWSDFRSKMDDDNDERIAWLEYSQYSIWAVDDDCNPTTETFDEIDIDGDGYIVKSEYINYLNEDW